MTEKNAVDLKDIFGQVKDPNRVLARTGIDNIGDALALSKEEELKILITIAKGPANHARTMAKVALMQSGVPADELGKMGIKVSRKFWGTKKVTKDL